MIFRNKCTNSHLQYRLVSDRIMVARIKASPVNILLVQAYAPCEDDDDDVKERFYDSLDQTIAENQKRRECLIVMGDFNGKVGMGKDDDIVGPYGLGERNENGQYLTDFCRRHDLFVTNT